MLVVAKVIVHAGLKLRNVAELGKVEEFRLERNEEALDPRSVKVVPCAAQALRDTSMIEGVATTG